MKAWRATQGGEGPPADRSCGLRCIWPQAWHTLVAKPGVRMEAPSAQNLDSYIDQARLALLSVPGRTSVLDEGAAMPAGAPGQ